MEVFEGDRIDSLISHIGKLMPKRSPQPLGMAFPPVFFVQLGLNMSAWLWFLLPAMLLSPASESFPAYQSLAPSAQPGLRAC